MCRTFKLLSYIMRIFAVGSFVIGWSGGGVVTYGAMLASCLALLILPKYRDL